MTELRLVNERWSALQGILVALGLITNAINGFEVYTI